MLNAAEIEYMIAPQLEAAGLFCMGWFSPGAAISPGNGLLIGNRAMVHADSGLEHRMWQVFSSSAEFGDGAPDPLDRWTRRLLDPVARSIGARPLYPFGQPVWPFQRWAMAATGMRASPLGILIHPQYGLWHAFRSAFIFEQPVAFKPAHLLAHPCDECVERGCVAACPVSAFGEGGFDASACRAHLASGNTPDCMALGCRARAACPVGIPYPDDQIGFHMRAFMPKA